MDIRSQIYPHVRDYCHQYPGGASLECMINMIHGKMNELHSVPDQLVTEELVRSHVTGIMAEAVAAGRARKLKSMTAWETTNCRPWPEFSSASRLTGRIIHIEGDLASGTIREKVS